MKKEIFHTLTEREADRIIEMAWEDRTPFDAIEMQFGLDEKDVITFMRRNLKPGSFRRWRKRVQGRATKHRMLRSGTTDRFRCSRQKHISGNRISKR
ncbi:TIGR03643 family protein [Robertkochia aurantiaca]|uniref:TIGR03643 family protein n=1 Tax=Robertkochia aurantiaca TaxID=2873700 RepID=UPI001CCDE891|nr:TIGR03643 family protein [Robertkochia sp. 3YJGBD-33]